MSRMSEKKNSEAICMRILKSSGMLFRNYPAPDSENIRHPIPELSGDFLKGENIRCRTA